MMEKTIDLLSITPRDIVTNIFRALATLVAFTDNTMPTEGTMIIDQLRAHADSLISVLDEEENAELAEILRYLAERVRSGPSSAPHD